MPGGLTTRLCVDHKDSRVNKEKLAPKEASRKVYSALTYTRHGSPVPGVPIFRALLTSATWELVWFRCCCCTKKKKGEDLISGLEKDV